MSYENDFKRIAAKLKQLAKIDPGCTLWGVEDHRYELNARISESAVSALESTHSVTLPDEYRYYLTHFANGGAGPAYGLFSLEKSFADYLKPNLPFPYDAGIRVLDSGHETGEELAKLGSFHDDPQNEHGKLVISELGCGIMVDLIVTGTCRGQVWIDDRTTEFGGLYPFDQFGNSEPLGFISWYEKWLDEAIAEIQAGA